MDAFTICPGGCGKKIKFCCGVDIIPELDKLERMFAGEQRRALLEHIAKMPAKSREKPCVLEIKARAELLGSDSAAHEATARRMLELYPKNALAMAMVAPYEVLAGRAREGVNLIQEAIAALLENSKVAPPPQALTGLIIVGRNLLKAGYVWAARAHLRLFDQLVAAEDNPASDMLDSMEEDAQVPLIWKDDPTIPACPNDAPFKDEYVAIGAAVASGQWRSAEAQFAALAKKYPDSPVVWRALAATRAFLADTPGAIEAYRKYADVCGNEEDAVEVELAILSLEGYDERAKEHSVDVVQSTLPVENFDELLPRMLSDKRLVRVDADLSSMASGDEPAPRDAFILLDRLPLEATENLRREEMPHEIADILLYGKETDRPARLLLTARRTDLAKSIEVLADATGNLVGAATEESVVGNIGPTQAALLWRWHWPAGASAEERKRVNDEEFRYRLLNLWPQIAMPHFDGRTYADAARDPRLRRRVLATILDLESNQRDASAAVLFNELRRSLGLPTLGEIEPFRVDLESISLLRLARLPALLMPDEQLIRAYSLATSMRAGLAADRLGMAILERSSIDNSTKAAVYLNFARTANDPRLALEHLHRGRDLDVAAGRSPAPWLLNELALRLSSGADDPGPLDAVLRQLSPHRKEPGVTQQMLSILAAYGVIDPSMMYDRAERAPGFSVRGVNLKPHVASPAGAEIGSPAAAPAEEKKSALWLPGMD